MTVEEKAKKFDEIMKGIADVLNAMPIQIAIARDPLEVGIASGAATAHCALLAAHELMSEEDVKRKMDQIKELSAERITFLRAQALQSMPEELAELLKDMPDE